MFRIWLNSITHSRYVTLISYTPIMNWIIDVIIRAMDTLEIVPNWLVQSIQWVCRLCQNFTNYTINFSCLIRIIHEWWMVLVIKTHSNQHHSWNICSEYSDLAYLMPASLTHIIIIYGMLFEMGKKQWILDYRVITDHREQGCFAVSELIKPFCFGMSYQFCLLVGFGQ